MNILVHDPEWKHWKYVPQTCFISLLHFQVFFMCQADLQPQCPETSLLQDTQQRIHVLAFEDNPCGSTVYPGLLVSSSSIVPRGMESTEQVRALAKWHHTRSRQLGINHRLNVVTVSVSLAADAQGEQVVLIPAHTQAK